MSAVEVNDENRAVCPGGKHSSSNADIFAIDQPTGRPSILRQTENLPSNPVQKGMKVCFQTPRRDPATKKILSPKSVKMSSVDESTNVLQALNLDMSTNLSDVFDQPKREPVSTFADDMPIQSKGGYQLDFDNLDAINPFEGSRKMALSPARPAVENPPSDQILSRIKEPENIAEEAANAELGLDETLPFIPSLANSLVDVGDVSSAESSLVTVVKLPALEELDSCTATPDEKQSANESSNLDPEVTTEALVDTEVSKIPNSPIDGAKLSNVDPIATVGSDSVPASAAKPTAEESPAIESAAMTPDDNDAAHVAKGSYSFDTDNFNDPYFNPFGTKVSLINSPVVGKKSSCVPTETISEAQSHGPVEEAASPLCIDSIPHSEPTNDVTFDPELASNLDTFSPEHEPPVQISPEVSQLSQSEIKPQTNIMDFNEEFVPGTTFMANDFDGQIDYLEQFGSSTFKESALRKQSLYLKFDPLLMESPKTSAEPDIPRRAAFVSQCESTQMAEMEATGIVEKGFMLLDNAAAPTSGLESLVPAFPQPADTEGAIIEVLKYSQKDMDATIALMDLQVEEKEKQWSFKYNKLLDDNREMRKIIAEFELVITKMSADEAKEREAAKAKLSDAVLEKEQVSSDLSAMERSFSDLFKRLEKYKVVIEGYKKNEETLKACAQDYLTRIKKEEQRYHTLKAHAEEKINQANEGIAEVQAKSKAEVSALQAQLRREQLKVHSLQRSLEQKEKETEELTKLCDELITKVQMG
ncbi:transforming acidic coiled-coil-containing protein 3 [Gouania willdenowi]|uniref:transforming acidic coiled-coil-containing protein 3 n=1 Tax=Gouania willdenowi TaxID=441366 RepID=UPI001056D9B7|nr:transforming acidic coiled-coil-containing protein 3 [Gouania willdenowi]